MKLKSFCTAQETINKMKRPPSEWEQYLQTKRQRINLQNVQATHEAQYQKNNQWAEDLNRHFSKEDIQIANDNKL